MKPASAAVNIAVNKHPTSTPQPSWFGRALRVSLLLFFLLIAAVLALPYALPWLLQQQGIDFNWDTPQWRLDGFSAARVQLSLPSTDDQSKTLQLDNLRLRWAWHRFPIQHLHAERLQVQWPMAQETAPVDEPPFSLPNALLKWLPQHIELPAIDADIGGIGHLQGSLNLQASAHGILWQPALIQTELTLNKLQGTWLDSIPKEFRPTEFNAKITTHPDHQDSSDDQQRLTVDMHSLGPMRLQLNGLLDLQQIPNWQGSLNNAQLFMQLDELLHPDLQAEQLEIHTYFKAHADSEQFSARLGEHSSIEAHNIKLLELGTAQSILLDLAGLNIQGPSANPLQAQISSPFSVQVNTLNIEQLHEQDWKLTGLLSGQLADLELNAQLTGQQGLSFSSQARLLQDSIQGRMTLDEVSFTERNPLQSTLKDWPEHASITSGQLTSYLDFNLPTAGPVQMALKVNAHNLNAALDKSRASNLNLDFSTALELHTTAENWQARLSDGQLLLRLDALHDPALQAKQLQARTNFTAQADSQTFAIHFDKTTRIEAHHLLLSDIGQAQKASITLPNLNIEGDTQTPEQHILSSPITMHLEQLSAAQLHTQNWDLSGTLKGALPRLKLNGDLSNTQGLSFTSQIQLLEHSVQGQATLKDIFFKAGNPLEKTLKDWPKLVLFDSGRLNSTADFTLPYNGTAKLSLNGSASGLSGIVNRSELKNLNFDFNGQLSGPTLKLSIPNLSIEQLDPGIPVGPIALTDAHYQARLSDLLKGVADWQHVQADLLNGRVWLNPQHLDLQHAQSVLLHVEGLELQELFRVYPAEGLAGNGTIDGQLPIYFDQDTFSISAGQLQARAPGVLQFQSEKIRALGKSNPTMRIVADALEDFHFNLLSSGLSYDQSGKLLLNVRLEGQNPDIEKGRPINLNVNLEENIPALLASIQLSSQVSEIIQKRIRERLEKR